MKNYTIEVILFDLYGYFILFYFLFKNNFFNNKKYFNEVSIKLIDKN